MKAILFVAAVAVLMNMVQAKVNHTFGLARLLFRGEPLADNLETMEENEKETKSAAQTCCFPKSFQGTIHIYEPGESEPSEAEIFVDADNDRLAVTDGVVRHVTSCSCCSCTQTTIDEHKRLCRQRILIHVDFDDMYDRCVPQKAKNLGTVKMGTDGLQQSSMIVQQWAFSEGNTDVRRMVTANGCFPVADIETDAAGPCQSQLVDVFYFDLVSPVKNPRVFAIPPYCPIATEVEAVRDEKPKWKNFYLRFK